MVDLRLFPLVVPAFAVERDINLRNFPPSSRVSLGYQSLDSAGLRYPLLDTFGIGSDPRLGLPPIPIRVLLYLTLSSWRRFSRCPRGICG